MSNPSDCPCAVNHPAGNNCQSPFNFYTCEAYIGCCTTDACNIPACTGSSNNNSPSSIDSTPASTSPDNSVSPAAASPTTIATNNSSASPQPTPASPSTTDSQTSTQSARSPAASPQETSSPPPVIVVVTSEVDVSVEFITSTSNGIVLDPATTVITSTWLSSLSTVTNGDYTGTLPTVVLGPSTTTSFVNVPFTTGSPPATSKTPIIGGTVGGVAGAVLAALLIFLFLRWNKQRKQAKKRRSRIDDDPRYQGIDAHRAGDRFDKDEEGKIAYELHSMLLSPRIQWLSAPKPISPQSTNKDAGLAPVDQTIAPSQLQDLLLSPNANYTGTDGNEAKQVRFSQSPVSPLTPSSPASNYNGGNAVRSVGNTHSTTSPVSESNDAGLGTVYPKPELSGVPASTMPAELSPYHGSDPINGSRKMQYPDRNDGTPSDAKRHNSVGTTDNSTMAATMDGSNGQAKEGRKHIMSWADYDTNQPGPAR